MNITPVLESIFHECDGSPGYGIYRTAVYFFDIYEDHVLVTYRHGDRRDMIFYSDPKLLTKIRRYLDEQLFFGEVNNFGNKK